jgi:hypothetical protein
MKLMSQLVNIVSAFLFLQLSAVVAQEQPYLEIPFGNPLQPGYTIHLGLLREIELGSDSSAAITSVINGTLNQNETAEPVKTRLRDDATLVSTFYQLMLETNNLVEAIKVLSETQPDKAVQVVSLGTTLYPDFVQAIAEGAALAGILSEEEVLLAVINAGGDPSLIAQATATGSQNTGLAIAPIGTGIGAGGTGGGDTTASEN